MSEREQAKKGKVETKNYQKGVEKKQHHDEGFPGRITFPNNPPLYTLPLPFPQRFRKTKLDEQFAKFLKKLKKLEVNIPFVDALAQMPNYVRFMKEIMSKKKKRNSIGTISLSKNYSAIIQRKLPKKHKDPSSFTISCIIGEHTISKALCDIGVSINLMPFSVATKLNLGEITPTSLFFQMVDS